jgi:uncharacterized membrane protein
VSLELLAHWLHLLAAALWVGGNLAVGYVVQPALRKTLEPRQRMAVFREIGRRFSYVQWACWSVLLVTGAHKLLGRGVIFEGAFGLILSVKLCLVGAMATLSLLHGLYWGPRLLSLPAADPAYPLIAGRMAFWGRVNAVLLVFIVGAAALLRFNPW